MKTQVVVACLLAALISAPAQTSNGEPENAEASRQPNVIDHTNGQIVELQVASGTPLTVRLNKDEKADTINLGDTANWRVTTNRKRDRLRVEALRPQGRANMTVLTNRGLYTFSLSSAPKQSANDRPRILQLRGSPQLVQQGARTMSSAGGDHSDPQYQLRGDVALRPSNVSEDGARTYIDWPPDAPLPAVYAIDNAGREALANGNMRDGRYVIDSVEHRLVFRIDKKVATATRITSGVRR